MDMDANDTTTQSQTSGLTEGEIVGIGVAVALTVVILVVVLGFCVYRKVKDRFPVYAPGNGMTNPQADISQERKASHHTGSTEYRHQDDIDWVNSASESNEKTADSKDVRSSNHKMGLDNAAFCEDEDLATKSKRLSDQHAESTVERRKNRMDSNLAAAIAAERDRNSSVFSIYNNHEDSEAVIVSDQRTAL